MAFPDPSVPIATCEAPDCTRCSVAHSIHCHFSPADLIHFYLICFPVFLVGGAAIFAVGWIPLIAWIGIIISFFGFIEIRVMCSHCPHYAEEGSTLRCWANYGSPKLWKHRPGPMVRKLLRTEFAKLALAGHAAAGGAEFQLLNQEFRRLIEKASLPTPALEGLVGRTIQSISARTQRSGAHL